MLYFFYPLRCVIHTNHSPTVERDRRVTASSTKVRFVVQVYFVFNAHDFFDPVRQPAEYFTVRDGKIKKHGTKNDQNTPARKQKREEREKKTKKKVSRCRWKKRKHNSGQQGPRHWSDTAPAHLQPSDKFLLNSDPCTKTITGRSVVVFLESITFKHYPTNTNDY